MTADQLISSDVSPPNRPVTAAERTVELIRSSFAAVEPHSEGLGKHFYATLFSRVPEVRDLFPVNMEVQRSRLLRALVHVVQMVDQPDDLVPFLQQLGRDHRKFGVLSQHYDALGDALISSIAAFAGEAWSPEVERAWTNAYATVANAMQEAAAAERGPASWMARVVDHRRIGWDLAVVTVETSGTVPFQAGQYVSVETPHRPRLWRYLSPANAPRSDGTIEFHVRAVADGWVSRAIVAHSQVGETWRVGPPMGRMAVPMNTNRELLMVAGGTGVAPMKALLDEVRRRQRPPRTQVFVGGRTWDDLYDFAALRRLSFTYPWLDVIPVVESEPESSGAEVGTLADVVTRYGAWNDHDVLVCGSPAMIRSTVSRMLVAGTPLDRITYDPFTMD
ncbi:MAG: globin domain-containing protein [Actinomycetota bacterium]|nr:globin domain-containing protein [Actinomycetota bacterium]